MNQNLENKVNKVDNLAALLTETKLRPQLPACFMLSFLRPEQQYRNDTQQCDDKGDKEIVVNGTDVSLQIDTLQYQHLRHFFGCIGRSAPVCSIKRLKE